MKHLSRPASAFSLVEVALSLGLAAFCLILMFAMLPIGLTSSRGAIEETTANGVLLDVISDLRSTSQATTNSARFNISIPGNPVTANTTTTLYFDGTGGFSPKLTETSRFMGTVLFMTNGIGIKTAIFARVKITWPAATKEAAPSNVTAFVALDRS